MGEWWMCWVKSSHPRIWTMGSEPLCGMVNWAEPSFTVKGSTRRVSRFPRSTVEQCDPASRLAFLDETRADNTIDMDLGTHVARFHLSCSSTLHRGTGQGAIRVRIAFNVKCRNVSRRG